MTIPELNCGAFAERLADFLERDVDETTRAGMEAHATTCADCGSLLADLRRLRVQAANLPELRPSADLWGGIAERIQTPVVALEPPNTGGAAKLWSGGSKARRLGLTWLGLAAAALVIVTASITHELTKRGLQPLPPTQLAAVVPPSTDTAVTARAPSTPAQPTTESVTTQPVIAPHHSTALPSTSSLVANHPRVRPSAQQTYETEIASLRLVLERRRPQLDSTTVAVVEHNLAVIDDAIAQCKAALRKDPASRFLMESLNDAMDDKVQLLRTAAVLPSKA